MGHTPMYQPGLGKNPDGSLGQMRTPSAQLRPWEGLRHQLGGALPAVATACVETPAQKLLPSNPLGGLGPPGRRLE